MTISMDQASVPAFIRMPGNGMEPGRADYIAP